MICFLFWMIECCFVTFSTPYGLYLNVTVMSLVSNAQQLASKQVKVGASFKVTGMDQYHILTTDENKTTLYQMYSMPHNICILQTSDNGCDIPKLKREKLNHLRVTTGSKHLIKCIPLCYMNS